MDTEKQVGGAGSASPPTAGSAADQVATWTLVRDLRNALAAAMRTLAAGGTCDEFLAAARREGVPDGIGIRSVEWLKQHAPRTPRVTVYADVGHSEVGDAAP